MRIAADSGFLDGAARRARGASVVVSAELSAAEAAASEARAAGARAPWGLVAGWNDGGLWVRTREAVRARVDVQCAAMSRIAALVREESGGVLVGGATANRVLTMLLSGEGFPSFTAPAEAAAWWAGLNEAQREAIAGVFPLEVGSLDGLPAAVRNSANRAILPYLRAGLEDERLAAIDRLRLTQESWWIVELFSNDDRALEVIEAKLAAIDAIADSDLTDRQLLLLDVSHERVRAAMAVGDVDTASSVAVFASGMSSSVEGSLTATDAEIAALRKKALDGRNSVAIISWFGYDAPQWADFNAVSTLSGSVLSNHAARTGAASLSSFYGGIRASRDAGSYQEMRLVAMGHSYGSTTTGLAVARDHSPRVDDVILWGSPGPGVRNVGELGVKPGHLFVVEADQDYVADFQSFPMGRDLNRMEGVTPLASDGSKGHSKYLIDNETSQRNIARVVAGRYQDLEIDSNVGIGDGVSEAIHAALPGGPLRAKEYFDWSGQ